MSYRAVGHVIFSLHLGVGHSVLFQLEGVGHVFYNHHISKCPGPPPPPPPALFDQSLNAKRAELRIKWSWFEPWQGTVVFLGKILYPHSASLVHYSWCTIAYDSMLAIL